jgi:hypothetical protein
MRLVSLALVTAMLVACDNDPTAENIQAQAVATADAIENRAEELTRAADNATDAEVNALENQIRALDGSAPAQAGENGAAPARAKD